MPKEGAAILAQIDGLMSQFLALDYDTPVKDQISQLQPVIQQAEQDMQAQGDQMDQAQQMQPQGGMPQGPPQDMSQMMQPGGPDPSMAPTSVATTGDTRQDFTNARQAAKADIGRGRFSGGKKGKPGKGSPDDKKKKKAKAY